MPADATIGNAINRVLAIRNDPPDTPSREGSQIAAMHELLRRMAIWADALACEDDWPLFSVASVLARRSAVIAERLRHVGEETAALGALQPWTKRLGGWYVEWCAIAPLLDDARLRDLPEPYEPAIRLLERGGYPSFEHGYFQIGMASFPIGRLRDRLARPPVTDLDDASLAQCDAEWRRR